MKLLPLLDQAISQAEFAAIIGVSEARVSQLKAEGVLAHGDTAACWLVSYCERLRDMAAGRASAGGGLDLVQERAALARSQRIAQDRKNAVDAGVHAPVGLLADVLGAASAAVVDRFDALEGMLAKACPDLPEQAQAVVLKMLASARNEWVRSTAELVDRALDQMPDAGDDGELLDPQEQLDAAIQAEDEGGVPA